MVAPSLRDSFGAAGKYISRYIHLRNIICKKHPNRPKNHVLEGLVLICEGTKDVHQNSSAIPMYVYFYCEFCAVKHFVRTIEEVTSTSFFVEDEVTS